MPSDASAPQHPNAVVSVNGTALDESLANLMTEVVVEDNLALPDMIVVTLRDQAHDVLSRGGFELGGTLEVKVASDAGQPEKLAEGEITSLEKDFQHGLGTFTVVRAFDKTHRLARGLKTKAFMNMSYSDVAKQVAQAAGLALGTVTSTRPVHDVVTQAGESDWAFLQRLAREVGFIAAMLGGKFDFRAPPEPNDAPDPAQHSGSDPRLLIPDRNLLSLRAIVRGAEQVGNVKVRGWDPKEKKEVVGTATPRPKTYTISSGLTPERVAGTFGSATLEYTRLPLSDQQTATNLAEALAEQVAAGMVEIEGVARGSKTLGAGTAIALANLGAPFEGKYVLTAVRHRFTPEDGYATSFTISGRNDRSLLSLASGGGGSTTAAGLMPAIVTDVKDPDKALRVKVKFPWLDESYVSDWARIVQPGAGGNRGSVMVPEVNDEVLVAFDQGDFRRPYVVGGVYNGKDKHKDSSVEPVDQGSGKINQRSFVSRKGAGLLFDDTDGSEAIKVKTGDGNQSFELLAGENKIKLDGNGEITVSGKGKITIKADGADLELSGMNIKIAAQTNLEMTASASAKLDGGGMTEVKGGVVKLN